MDLIYSRGELTITAAAGNDANSGLMSSYLGVMVLAHWMEEWFLGQKAKKRS